MYVISFGSIPIMFFFGLLGTDVACVRLSCLQLLRIVAVACESRFSGFMPHMLLNSTSALSVQGILTTLSQSDGAYPYDYATVPFLAEVFKVHFSHYRFLYFSSMF